MPVAPQPLAMNSAGGRWRQRVTCRSTPCGGPLPLVYLRVRPGSNRCSRSGAFGVFPDGQRVGAVYGLPREMSDLCG